jgi:hypothetical protein
MFLAQSILGLPDCKCLSLVDITCTLVDAVDRSVSITMEDFKKRYPKQFDAIGRFKETTRIILKDDAEQHIDKP